MAYWQRYKLGQVITEITIPTVIGKPSNTSLHLGDALERDKLQNAFIKVTDEKYGPE